MRTQNNKLFAGFGVLLLIFCVLLGQSKISLYRVAKAQDEAADAVVWRREWTATWLNPYPRRSYVPLWSSTRPGKACPRHAGIHPVWLKGVEPGKYREVIDRACTDAWTCLNRGEHHFLLGRGVIRPSPSAF
jgi:hypothetical protein